MHSNIHFSPFFLVFLLLTTFSNAQDIPIEWKEIPLEDLKMTSYPADTAASALILCDYGFTDFNDDLDLIFKRHLRIKIFNENGYDLASLKILIDEEYESIDDIEGITYQLNDQGKVIKSELDDDDILKEKVTSDLVYYKFTMPALQPGCIIDIRYRIYSTNIYMVKDWLFQYSEPVRWSEYRVLSLRNIAYSAVTRGYERFYINETTQTTKIVSGQAQWYTKTPVATCNMMRWVVKDAPAIREEAFITCTDDYKNKVEVQLSGYTVPGHGVEVLNKNWGTFVKDNLEGKWLGQKISSSGTVKNLAAKITSELNTPEEKMIALYNWVASSVTWSGRQTRWAEKSMDQVIDTKQGNSAEINLLLISLLRSAGISCEPFMLSTRGNGRIQDLYPIYSQFNYVIARATVGSKQYFLDATDPLRPYDILPSKVINVKAIAIKEGPVEWQTLRCDKKNLTASAADITIDEDGKVEGTIETSFGEYRSIYLRNELSKGNELITFKKEWDTDLFGFELDSLMVLTKDSLNQPLHAKAYISSDHYTQVSGDMIYLNPNMVFRIDKNPFQLPVRKYPVDYGYKRASTVELNITIPEGYEIHEKLRNRTIMPKGPNLTYSRKVVQDGNQLKIVCKFDIRDSEVKQNLYEELKQFYTQVLSAQSEQIVLKKVTP